MKPSICTASGIEFDLLAPTPAMVAIEDIAHALSHMPRFAGHTREFYSVAQHSVHVAQLVERAAERDGIQWPAIEWRVRVALLHDAAEAYCLDVPTPLKSQLSRYVAIEDGIRAAIFERFRIHWSSERLPGFVKWADRQALLAEQRDLMPSVGWWVKQALPEIPPLVPMSPAAARDAFLQAWEATHP